MMRHNSSGPKSQHGLILNIRLLMAGRARLTRPSRHDCQGLCKSSHESSLLAVRMVAGSMLGRSRADPCLSALAMCCLPPAGAASRVYLAK